MYRDDRPQRPKPPLWQESRTVTRKRHVKRGRWEVTISRKHHVESVITDPAVDALHTTTPPETLFHLYREPIHEDRSDEIDTYLDHAQWCDLAMALSEGSKLMDEIKKEEQDDSQR